MHNKIHGQKKCEQNEHEIALVKLNTSHEVVLVAIAVDELLAAAATIEAIIKYMSSSIADT